MRINLIKTVLLASLMILTLSDWVVKAQDHEYQGTLGIWFCPDNNYGANDTNSYLRWINEHPDWFRNPAFQNLKAQGGSIYSIEQPDRFAKILRGMRRATADVIVVDPLDEHTDPWSCAMHYFADALENQPPDAEQLKWMFWTEFWSADRDGPGWYGATWHRWIPMAAPYQTWSDVKQKIDYIWENYAQRPHYYRWNGKPMLVIEADTIGQQKPVWYEQIMADNRFYVHFVADVVHNAADYPSDWLDWVWPYWVDIGGKFNPDWMGAVRGTYSEGEHRLERLFDKQTGKSPAGGNSDPPKFILIPAYNDYIMVKDPKHVAWIEPLFDPKDDHLFGFQNVDELAHALGRKQSPNDLDSEGKTYSLKTTIAELASLLEYNRQHYGMARVFNISADQYTPGRLDVPVFRVRLYPYRGYNASKSFDTIVSMSVRNVGTAETSIREPGFDVTPTIQGEIDTVWLVHVSAVDGTHTRVGLFRTGPDGILRWKGHYPIRFEDELLVMVDLAPTARKGRTMQFELVVDPAKDAKGVEFVQEYGSDRFSPIQTVRNKYVQVVR